MTSKFRRGTDSTLQKHIATDYVEIQSDIKQLQTNITNVEIINVLNPLSDDLQMNANSILNASDIQTNTINLKNIVYNPMTELLYGNGQSISNIDNIDTNTINLKNIVYNPMTELLNGNGQSINNISDVQAVSIETNEIKTTNIKPVAGLINVQGDILFNNQGAIYDTNALRTNAMIVNNLSRNVLFPGDSINVLSDLKFNTNNNISQVQNIETQNIDTTTINNSGYVSNPVIDNIEASLYNINNVNKLSLKEIRKSNAGGMPDNIIVSDGFDMKNNRIIYCNDLKMNGNIDLQTNNLNNVSLINGTDPSTYITSPLSNDLNINNNNLNNVSSITGNDLIINGSQSLSLQSANIITLSQNVIVDSPYSLTADTVDTSSLSAQDLTVGTINNKTIVYNPAIQSQHMGGYSITNCPELKNNGVLLVNGTPLILNSDTTINALKDIDLQNNDLLNVDNITAQNIDVQTINNSSFLTNPLNTDLNLNNNNILNVGNINTTSINTDEVRYKNLGTMIIQGHDELSLQALNGQITLNSEVNYNGNSIRNVNYCETKNLYSYNQFYVRNVRKEDTYPPPANISIYDGLDMTNNRIINCNDLKMTGNIDLQNNSIEGVLNLNGSAVSSFLTNNISTPLFLNGNNINGANTIAGTNLTLSGSNSLSLSSSDDITFDNNIRIVNGYSLYTDNVITGNVETTTLNSKTPQYNPSISTLNMNTFNITNAGDVQTTTLNSKTPQYNPSITTLDMNNNQITNCTQLSHGTQLTLFGGETLTLNCGSEIDVKKPLQMNGFDIKDSNNVNAINYHQKYQNNVYIPMTRYTCEYGDSLTYNLPNPAANVQATFKGSFLGPGAYSLHATAHYHIKYAFFLSTTTAGGIFTLSLVIGGTSVLITSTTALAIGSYIVEYDIYMYVHSGTLTSIQTTLYSKVRVAAITATLNLSFPAATSNQNFTGLVNGIVSPSFTIQSTLASNQWNGNRRSYLFTRDA